MLILGVDPGDMGAACLLAADGSIVHVWDAPQFALAVCELAELVHDRDGSQFAAFVEASHAFPKIQATTNWKMGAAYDFWRGVCLALGIPFQKVAASKWQTAICGQLPRGAKKKRQRKKAICEWAEARWPRAELRGPRGAILDGRSDALCIGEYGRRVTIGVEEKARAT